MRINKFLALCGLGSRRFCESLVSDGKIVINGKVLNDLSYKVLDTDVIKFNGKLVTKEDKVYYVMNKPVGYVTTTKDPHAKKTVMDLVTNIPEKIFPVGRLDKETSGIILFTNDGDFSQKFLKPKTKLYKTYVAEINGKLNRSQFEKFKKGVLLENGIKTLPARLKYLKDSGKNGIYEVEICEGKNRQIRKMFEELGCKVLKLERIRILNIDIKSVKEGTLRQLSKEEIEKIFEVLR